MARKITEQLHKQITGWRIYSIVAPAIFCAVSAWLYIHYGAQFQTIFYTGLIVLGVTCISWWHWSLSTMLSMLGIMRDTDDHFEVVANELKRLHDKIPNPPLKLVKNIDSSAE